MFQTKSYDRPILKAARKSEIFLSRFATEKSRVSSRFFHRQGKNTDYNGFREALSLNLKSSSNFWSHSDHFVCHYIFQT
ncbi:MAG: hypothetical protein DRI57_23470 [Deltaproteobacteria bacterium]|nr:MAG: hypothetical protein DRI57_23470 [Deltaproteobacteria bacterium]